jgi:uncharacterized protein (DUF1778 family)
MTDQKTAKRPRGRPATGQTPQHQFRCPDDEWELFVQAAEADGVTVATWIRTVALRAAKRTLQK